MRDRLRRLRARLIVAGAVGGSVIAIALPAVQGGGGGDVANLWVDTTGGTCTRTAGAGGAYSDAGACGPAQAFDASTAGDTIRIKPGTYTGLQNFTSDKASTVTMIGEDVDTVIFSSTGSTLSCSGAQTGWDTGYFCFSGDRLRLENATFDSGTTRGQSNGFAIHGSNITFANVNATGDYVSTYISGPDFTWDGGYHGIPNGLTGQREGCGTDGEPIWVEDDAPNLVMEDVTIWPGQADNTPCAGSVDGFHYEAVRLQSATNPTFRRVRWAGTNVANTRGVGSGHIFMSSASATGVQNVKLYQVVMEHGDGNYSMQVGGAITGGSCAGFEMYYSTILMAPGLACDLDDSVWIGNTGPYPGCDGTGSGNVWQRSSPVSCAGRSTDVFVTGPDYVPLGSSWTNGWGNLGLDTTVGNPPKPQAGSAVLNAAQATCATFSPDIEGIVTRPQGAKCDAGAYERAG